MALESYKTMKNKRKWRHNFFALLLLILYLYLHLYLYNLYFAILFAHISSNHKINLNINSPIFCYLSSTSAI